MIPRVLVGWHVNVRCKLHAPTQSERLSVGWGWVGWDVSVRSGSNCTLLRCYTILVLVLCCAYMFACTPEVLRSWSKETLFVFPKRCETVKTRGVFHKRVTVLNKPARTYIYIYIDLFFIFGREHPKQRVALTNALLRVAEVCSQTL